MTLAALEVTLASDYRFTPPNESEYTMTICDCQGQMTQNKCPPTNG